ncbi:unnamed protein product [Caenorhabditis sp. 36 PRJEB53466]|nr:unnamed protein product [Caenorhabditis sp. 36 PRJEB53466]
MSVTHKHAVFRRSQSTRSPPDHSPPSPIIRRQRPSTLYVKHPSTTATKKISIPTVSVHEMPTMANAECLTVHHQTAPPQKNLCPNSSYAERFSRSASSSPRRGPGGHGAVVVGPGGELRRRESVLQMLNRIWKSDECTRRPSVQKSNALDVPAEPLSRQLSLSDTNVNPQINRCPKLNLTPKQKKLLRQSFNAMNSGGTFLKLMEKIFRRLENKCPDMRSIFLTTAFVNSLSRERSSPPLVKTENDHCKCMVGIFERLIENLDNIHEQLTMIRHYGEKHAQMAESGFTGTMIEQFGEISVFIIGSQDVVKFNHDTVKAWRLLLACVTDEMKVGFDRMTRINGRRNSSKIMESKHAAKQIDPKDLSPAWKVLQMKLKEEKEEKEREKAAEKVDKVGKDEGFTKVQSKKQRQRENRKRRAQEALATASEPKKVHHDIPVVIEDNERGELTKVLAIDCEYVGAGMNGSTDILARISVVNELGKIVYDKFVKPSEKVTDYRTAVSGIRPENMHRAIPFDRAQTEISKILDGRIIVGHAVHNDFRVLKLNHTRKLTRDTAKCSILRNMANHQHGSPSLKKLAKEVLGIEIQKGEHDSITDARVALRLYEAVKKQWEAEIKRYR